ncbi:MAG: signal peptidase I [Deltaproteobacteria bacterium RBG_13_52_11]|nr:MAG: signal peptidase I [Deltaproteobacteria bacterium RBG_13_52_11]
MPKVKQKSKVREYAETLIIALVIALFVRTFVVQAFKIPSGSMEPTLLVGDHILVNKFMYGIRIPLIGKKVFPLSKPRRGDVIVFIFPNDRSKDFIKRVIGLPGEKVEIRERKIYINDRLIEDPWGVFSSWGLSAGDNYGPKEVPPGFLLVLGDNRDNSQDSRYWGFVPLDDVLGKAFIMYWSWDWRASSFLSKVRWERIGRIIR